MMGFAKSSTHPTG